MSSCFSWRRQNRAKTSQHSYRVKVPIRWPLTYLCHSAADRHANWYVVGLPIISWLITVSLRLLTNLHIIYTHNIRNNQHIWPRHLYMFSLLAAPALHLLSLSPGYQLHPRYFIYLFIYLLQTTVGPYTNRRLKKKHTTIEPERRRKIHTIKTHRDNP